MEGIIVYNSYNMLGSITENTEQGIYGELDRVDTLFRNAEPVKVAGKDEIEEGNALIRCCGRWMCERISCTDHGDRQKGVRDQ